MKKYVVNFKNASLYMIYFFIFAFAALGKFTSDGVPDWFSKQFGSTFLNVFSGALAIQFYTIATLEAVTALIFLGGLLRLEFILGKKKTLLSLGLSLAMMIFIILEVGLQATHDFNTAIQVFIYFAFSWYLLNDYAIPKI